MSRFHKPIDYDVDNPPPLPPHAEYYANVHLAVTSFLVDKYKFCAPDNVSMTEYIDSFPMRELLDYLQVKAGYLTGHDSDFFP